MGLEHLVEWISLNPEWAYLIIFLIAFGESLAVVGLLIPGWLLLQGVGVLIGAGSIHYLSASLFCFLGAVTGEYLSFWIGRRYQSSVRHWQIFKSHPNWLSQTDHFFERFGVASIALGRFVGPVRAFVPLIAGMSSMPVMKFQLVNVLSAMVWGPVYLIPGIVLGASTQIEGHQSWTLVAVLGLLMASVWFSTVYGRNLWRIHHPKVLTGFDRRHALSKFLAALCTIGICLWLLIEGSLSSVFFELLGLLQKVVWSA